MTAGMLTVFSILIVAVVFLVTEWIPMEVTALLVLGTVALTGLVSPGEALSGFSNPAVVTVWAVFILSGGLTRTGVANLIGRVVLRLSGRSETLLVVVIMTCAGAMSAIMNNVAVAALLMPVVMDIARSTRVPASRLLLPLAYGSLLGGLTTLIGTPPNILVSEALRENGLAPFSLFDFTPIGLIVFAAGVGFMALVGGRLLPARDLQRDPAQDHALPLHQQYHLEERLMRLRIPRDSTLVGRTLVESRLGTILGLTVVGVRRNGRIIAAPGPDERLRAGDALIVEGGPGGLLKLRAELESWSQLALERESTMLESIYSEAVGLAELQVAPHAEIAGKTISEIGFRARFGLNVVAVRRGETIQRSHLQDRRLDLGDILLVQGLRPALAQAGADPQFTAHEATSPEALMTVYHLENRSLVMRVREESRLVGRTLQESRLGVALGVSVLSLIRGHAAHPTPEPEMRLAAEDRLIVAGRRSDFDLLQGIQEIVLEPADQQELEALESEEFGLMEAMLAPHTTLSGKTLRELHFREKYGLTVLAIWREGKLYRADFLRDMALRFGDALLLYGARANYALLGREPDFVVLTQSAQERPHLEKAKISIAVMTGVLLPVMMGWVPIYLAAVIGAAVMVLTRCLTMDEAYRAIEWKGIFLIAGMLPLGTALDATGAARLLANGVVAAAGSGGPYTVMAGLMIMTFMATCVIPTAALVVLMAPIILSTAGDLGVSPYPMMMAMAMCASASFMTPISHPANVMVMGPGGYRFSDYIKVGFPLTVVVGITVLLALPLFWPFSPAG